MAYIDKKQRANDEKSTFLTFSIVGILGLVLLVLLDLDLLPIHLQSSNKIMVSIVMGLVFLIFIVIGILSLLNHKKLISQAVEQEAAEEDILDCFRKAHQEDLEKLGGNEELEEQELYFLRNERINFYLSTEYPNLTEDEADHYSDLLYDQIFKDN